MVGKKFESSMVCLFIRNCILKANRLSHIGQHLKIVVFIPEDKVLTAVERAECSPIGQHTQTHHSVAPNHSGGSTCLVAAFKC